MKDTFLEPVSEYMKGDVETVPVSATAEEIARRLSERGVSAVPVVGPSGTIIGVVSRSDLVHARKLAGHTAADLIQRAPIVCDPHTSLRAAARLMVREGIHRVFVVEDGRPVGVVSTLDMTAAVRDARLDGPIGKIMTAPVITIPAVAPLHAAITELDRAHVTGLIVVDERWPIGTFTQTEALAARDLAPDTPVDDLMDPAVICMPVETRLYHAAAQASRLDVRRVIACHAGEAVGVVSGLDFAKVVAG